MARMDERDDAFSLAARCPNWVLRTFVFETITPVDKMSSTRVRLPAHVCPICTLLHVHDCLLASSLRCHDDAGSVCVSLVVLIELLMRHSDVYGNAM